MARMRHFLKRCPAVLLSAALLAAAVGTAAAADTPAPTLGIYTTGDMGGRLYREDPVTGEAVEYSYQNVASAMEAERASVDAALLLDSGDAVDNGLVQDGGAAEALALRAIGYDALVPAVGEFRLGPEARNDFFAALGEASEDGRPGARPLGQLPGRGHPKPGGGCLRGLYRGAGPARGAHRRAGPGRHGGAGGAARLLRRRRALCPPGQHLRQL